MTTNDIPLSYERWKTAVMRRDIVSMRKICVENFFWTNNMGVTHSKNENLNKIASGAMYYISWTTQNMSIETVDNITCIVRTKDLCKMLVYGIEITAMQDLTIVFIKEKESWLLACVQETTMN